MKRRSYRVLFFLLLFTTLGIKAYSATYLRKFQVALTLQGTFQNPGSGSTADFAPKVDIVKSFTDGVGANQAEVLYYAEDSVTASGTDVIDLAGGLTDKFGNVLTLSRIKAVWVENRSAVAGDIIQLKRPASNGAGLFAAASGAMPIYPGGGMLWYNQGAISIDLVGGTGDLLNIVEVGGAHTVNYRILILGTDTAATATPTATPTRTPTPTP